MIGYLDLPSGVSGDMLLGCLLDAGWTLDQFRAALAKLHLPEECEVDAREVMKGPLRATRAIVYAPGAEIESAAHPHFHPHGHSHEHPHSDAPEAHAHPQGNRNLHDIQQIIANSDLAPAVKQKSIAVFTRLARAEATVHGTTLEKIHFHEVGALDAIVDIVCTVAGLHDLGIEPLYASPLPAGRGWINSQHGKLPLPAPATLELLAAAGAPTCAAPGPGELVTPTGAALVCELARFEQPAMVLNRIAIGAGKKDMPWPNVARLWLGNVPVAPQQNAGGQIVQIETNIDDMNPQFYAPLMDRLFAAGALDVWLVPMQMKKSRPGITLSLLCPVGRNRELADLILRETTTLGVRMFPVERYEAAREIQVVDTPFGKIQIKLKKWGGRLIGATPEYEDCRKLAETSNLPMKQVYDAAVAAAHRVVTDRSAD